MTAAHHGALALGLGRRSLADIMAATRDITVATLMASPTARIVTGTGMATTTQAVRTSTIARGMIGRSLRAFKLAWPVPAITLVRSTA